VPVVAEAEAKRPVDFGRYEKRAQEIAADFERAADVVEQASAKARAKAGNLRSIWGDLQALLRLLRAWANRRYTRVPWGAVVMGLAAVLYLLNPLDLAPDFIPLVGYVDDATVIAFVIRSIQKELDKFREWEASDL
jgi:uncharacterized membrane protein YkvA (DUF1232 family)